MKYKFTDDILVQKVINLEESNKINPFLIKNFSNEIIDSVGFLTSNQKFLYIHGFLGVGKRQFINYFCESLNKDVVKLEYFCKESTVIDDILLNFIEIIQQLSVSKIFNISPKITSLSVEFMRYVSSIKKPFLIILHTFDNISNQNSAIITKVLSEIIREDNIKVIITTKGIRQDLIPDINECKNITLKAFNDKIYSEFLNYNSINISGKSLEDFYKYTRGYYFYTVLSVKIIQAMKITPEEFIQRIKQADVSFDSFIGITYINLIPKSIGNFFWFLKMLRHGISLNALAVLGIYDEFSLEYLKSNLVTFISNENVYLHDYFIQELDVLIPPKIETKLHKYIINIYEEQLKMPVKDRLILISRQALRNEIDYHNSCINSFEKNKKENLNIEQKEKEEIIEELNANTSKEFSYTETLQTAKQLVNERKFTEAIEIYQNLIDTNSLDLPKLADIRLELARLYYKIGEFMKASRYYDLVETYQIHKNENINLMYLYYEMAELYHCMYKNERAIETTKKIIYSVDSPPVLIVKACLLIGNIYTGLKQDNNAYNYYKKGIESSNLDIDEEILSELYFKYALANDDKGNLEQAYEYYNKCIACRKNNQFIAEAYSNLASCYNESENYDDALACFEAAYKIEKDRNNYEGIYYVSLNLAKLYSDKIMPEKALKFLIEARQSAEFVNEDFYIISANIALGDFYYNDISHAKDALQAYYKAKSILKNINDKENSDKVDERIEDMKLRMNAEDFAEIKGKYER